MSSKRIVVIGAGPIGLEAALYGLALGHEVQVFEKARVGQNMRDWGHVRLFSPWSINHSHLGVDTMQKAGVELPGPDDYLTGTEYVERYLHPLVRSAPLEGRVREGTEVLHVGRDGIGKRDLIGGPRRDHAFRILIRGPQGEVIVEADAVLDCTGTYGNPNWMGNGNIPALGERELRDRIDYHLVDVAGAARERYEDKRVLLVGSGHSAATALDDLTRLDGISIVWVTRTDKKNPLAIVANDPLLERARLSEKANALASGSNPNVAYRSSTEVEKLRSDGDGFEVTLRTNSTMETLNVDRILAHVGFSPDNRIYRELQVHECYASLGPMKLSAALLAENSADSADCLAQTSKGADVLENPEPGFFILGSKSYGKNSNFLIRIGIQQVQEVYSLVEGRPDLNLYGS
jgi:thioredoxin reductase